MAETRVQEDNHLEEDQDRINLLNDEILILILSFLSLIEAGRTCVLSRRWKDLWKHHRRIHIDCETDHKTVSRVNRILKLHQGSTVDELRIRTCSTTEDFNGVDNWVKFALEKNVRKFELDLKGHTAAYYHDIKYVFPEKPFKFLTHLSLIYVNASSGIMHKLLSQCQLLEHICVCGSNDLHCLRVIGPALRLKSLQISECIKLVMVKISAPNLVSFIYEGVGLYRYGIKILHAPSLVKIHLGEDYDCITKSFLAVRDYFLQLVTLSIRLNLREEQIILPEFQAFTKLRNLSLAVVIKKEGQSLLNLTSLLIEKSPFLQSFTIELIWNYFEPKVRRSMLHIRESPHRCLKVVRFTGFIGLDTAIDTELAMYLIQNAVVLEQLILDIGTETTENCYKERDPVKRTEQVKARKEHALKFGAQLPPGAELILL